MMYSYLYHDPIDTPQLIRPMVTMGTTDYIDGEYTSFSHVNMNVSSQTIKNRDSLHAL